MEDILKFLLVIGFLVFGFVKQANKGKSSPTEGESEMPPMPDENNYEPIPQVPPTKETECPTHKSPRHKKQPHMPVTPRPAPSPSPKQTEKGPDYNIQSIEEVRRAIIWSEILDRKYS